jgi:pimeloyl-ACP methyl ester carboxylesterase
MSFAYQFPEWIDQLGLVASGGLGPELTIALRAATVPGVTRMARAISAVTPHWMRQVTRGAATGLGLASGAELDALAYAVTSLAGRDGIGAFERTLRGAVDRSGQVLAATDRLCLLADLPILLIAGRHDRCIPYLHSVHAHDHLPGSQLEILETGHFPQLEDPDAVARLLVKFLLPRRSPGLAYPPVSSHTA